MIVWIVEILIELYREGKLQEAEARNLIESLEIDYDKRYSTET